jgi:hypothetical protein
MNVKQRLVNKRETGEQNNRMEENKLTLNMSGFCRGSGISELITLSHANFSSAVPARMWYDRVPVDEFSMCTENRVCVSLCEGMFNRESA